MLASLAAMGISSTGPCFVIAEVGVNHNGDMPTAFRLIEEAKRVGADCVKFQSFRADRVATRAAPKAAYQLRVTNPRESQFEMLKALELSPSQHRELIDCCRHHNIQFLSTPYDIKDAEMLLGLGVRGFKLASIHLVEIPYLRELAALRLPLILSTGMATLAEVDVAVRTLRDHGLNGLVVLQCTTNYPSLVADANLRAMITMRDSLGVCVGYSDHTEGIAVTLASAALGARVIEKHFTLNRSMPGPDHACSSDPDEFAVLVRGIRDVEAAMGSGVKSPSEAERANTVGMRRSIFAARDLSVGDTLSSSDVLFKRPATGIAPARLHELLGRQVCEPVKADSPLEWRHVGR
jgi:N,N'-diacetyllegionaminate synthase